MYDNYFKIIFSYSFFQWYPLEGCKHGDLHVKTTWMNLSSNPGDLRLEEKDVEWMQV